MLILGQSGDVMVNVEHHQCFSIYQINNHEHGKEMEKRFRILAWYGSGEDDCWGIGDYATEDRAKEVLREIWEKYAQYLHRKGGPAILKGSVDVPEEFWVLPKVYEMPKE